VPHQRARINIPNYRYAMTFQIVLRRFTRSPVGRQRGKFAHNEPFDIRFRGFFVVKIRAHVPDMRIRKADNLAGITWVGENFLVAGDARIKNDFSAAARASAGCAAFKYSPVFER
jgi:hypothetical protein